MLIKLRIFIATQLSRYIHSPMYVLFHCSLYHNSLTDSGAIALANALQQNKSLKELK